MIWIGIDAGSHTGIAVWDGAKEEFRLIDTVALWKALELVKKWQFIASGIPTKVTVVFEDARQRKWLPSERTSTEYRGKLMGAGSVKRDCSIWEEFCTDNKINFIAVPPQAGLTKWPAEHFTRLTGWKGRTSNHSRDAALLVYGK